MKANILQSLTGKKLCTVICLILLSACGEENRSSDSHFTYDNHTQEFHTFDYVYGGSEMAVIDIKTETALTSKKPLLVDHLFYGSSMRGTREYVFHHSANKVIDILLYDRNLQKQQKKIEIIADSEHQYWVFAFGNVKKNDYSLYVVKRPSVRREQGKVLLYVIYASELEGGKHLQVSLNGGIIATQLVSRRLSAAVQLDDDLSSLAFSLKLPNGKITDCALMYPVHDDVESRVRWNESNWLLVVTEKANYCHLHSVY